MSGFYVFELFSWNIVKGFGMLSWESPELDGCLEEENTERNADNRPWLMKFQRETDFFFF